MKLEKTKKFFFDTWYGALVVLFGVTTSYFVAVIVNSYRIGSFEGSAVAQYYLGVSYAEGEGGFEKNPQEAVKWLRKAAEQGHAEAQYYLEKLKEKGKTETALIQ